MSINNEYNNIADNMINRIILAIDDKLKQQVRLSSAIVDSVNQNNTVNIYFPPDNDIIFSNIKNQTNFILQSGDSVEVLLKDGTYNNCWIVAKHGDTFTPAIDYGDSIQQIADTSKGIENSISDIKIDINNLAGILSTSVTNLNAAISSLRSSVSALQSSVSSLSSRVSTLESDYVALEKRVKALEEKS